MAKALYEPKDVLIRHVNLKLSRKLHKQAWEAAKKKDPPQSLQHFIVDSILKHLAQDWAGA